MSDFIWDVLFTTKTNVIRMTHRVSPLKIVFQGTNVNLL